jgi:transposase
MEQRVQFIRDWLTRRHAVSELCARYGVSRKTGYKWIERYMADGPDGLRDRSHQVQLVHNKTAPHVEQALLALRQRHPSWGAKKLLSVLSQREPRAGAAGALDRVRHPQPQRLGAQKAQAPCGGPPWPSEQPDRVA